jgi:hypothetical protein
MDINKIKELDKELSEQKRKASDLLAQAKLNKNNLLKREDGVEVKEEDLWTEVFRLGSDCRAGKMLKEKYPEVFEAYEEQKKRADNLDQTFFKEFGFNFNQMTPSRLISFVEAIINGYNNNNKIPLSDRKKRK